MKLPDPSRLKMRGDFQERLLRSIRHLRDLNTAEMRMEFTQPNEFWHWGADYMGRWISAMGLLEQYTGEDFGVWAVAQELLAFQKSDGSFGPYTDPHDFQEWFGMSRGLVGLLEYYQVHPVEQVLQAAVRLGDYYTRHYPDCDPCMYECFSTALEGMVLLYKITGDGKYLETARRMAQTSAVFTGVLYSQEVSATGRRTPIAGQVHCQLSTARGLLDLFEISAEDQYLKPVLDLHDAITQELMWVSGGVGFYYFRPEENESCADADWFRLNLQLWRLTGKAGYMHLAERILLNQLYFNQADNGGFCYLRGLQNRAGAVFDACCSHHGPRALVEAMRYMSTASRDQVWINLYLDGEVWLDLEGRPMLLSTSTQLSPGQMAYTIHVQEAPAGRVTINARLPDWAQQSQVLVNGQAVQFPAGQDSMQITRAWQVGDRIELLFPLRLSVVRGQRLGQHILAENEAAVFYGPWLFSLNDALNPAVRLHLVRLRLTPDTAQAFTVIAPDRIEAAGSTPGRPGEHLVFSPLATTGGAPSGSGRIHTVRSPYYRVWIPVESTQALTG